MVEYTHTFALPSGASLDFDANVRAASKTWLAVDFTPTERAPAFAMLNSALSYHSAGDHYSIGAFVRNINNAKEYTGGYENTFGPPQFAAIISPPRTYGAQFNLNF
jgi:outer membrane receptor protein involved in Fe transport